jgi:predicted amino acid-binding ACT domain protein
LIQGEDRPGAIADLMGKFAAANINVTAIDAVSSGQGLYGAILWVKSADLRKAAMALGI